MFGLPEFPLAVTKIIIVQHYTNTPSPLTPLIRAPFQSTPSTSQHHLRILINKFLRFEDSLLTFTA